MYVSSDAADSRPLRLMLRGVSVAGIEVEPPCAFFNGAPTEGRLERVVRICDPASNRLFRITGVACDDPRFVTRIETAEEGRDYRLVVGCIGPREQRAITTSVTVRTDHPEYTVLKVPVYLTTQESVRQSVE